MADPPAPLSPRMVECLLAAALGRNAEDIAGDLGISQRTVETHLRRARTKLCVPNTLAAVAWLIRATEVK